MSSNLILIGIVMYMIVLFLIAFAIEKGKIAFLQKINYAWIYALSLGVYCTAWTFYGSVGRASYHGPDFLTIYLGPVIIMPLWWIIVRKIVRISKSQHIGSIADFISSRYGKDQKLGTIVALLLLIGIIPYLALQIKALSESTSILMNVEKSNELNLWTDPGLYIMLAMGIFIMLFGIRFLNIQQIKTGLVGTVAFESMFKLVAFLTIGIVVCFYIFKSPMDIFKSYTVDRESHEILFLSDRNVVHWFAMIVISGLSILLLPRQFQMAIVENRNEQDIKKSIWIFPLYLFLINLFVLPIALAGQMKLGTNLNPDYYILGLAKMQGSWLELIVYLGGLSAATSMIIVSTVALGGMVSNNVIVPLVLYLRPKYLAFDSILPIRRLSIVVILVLGYLYYVFMTSAVSLLNIGIISFVAVSQLAPAVIGGIYWKGANRKGVLSGILGGFIIWIFLLIIPSTAWGHSVIDSEFIKELLPVWTVDERITYAIGFTLSVNMLLFIGVSLYTYTSNEEKNQAELFVDIFKFSRKYNEISSSYASAPFANIKTLLERFIGDYKTSEVLDQYARSNDINWKTTMYVDAQGVAYAERLLTDVIGPASARIMISSVVQDEEISIHEVVDILEESKEVIQLNRQLKFQSDQLQRLAQDLKTVNEELQRVSAIKDDFLYTVTHELRTPLTSIRAHAEILVDMEDDITIEERQTFLNTIIRDCERLTRLITDVLDLEKFESGNQKLHLTLNEMHVLLHEALTSINGMIEAKSIQVSVDIAQDLPRTFLDRDRIIQVLINLLSNAIKYCPFEGGMIDITIYQIEDAIRVNISDNGPGIPKDNLHRIFEKFYQASNQLRKKPAGTGLGLAICKNIIKHHQGKIYAKNKEGGGAKFSFELPIYRTTKQFIDDYERKLKKDFDRG